jgi:hypothetical protein
VTLNKLDRATTKDLAESDRCTSQFLVGWWRATYLQPPKVLALQSPRCRSLLLFYLSALPSRGAKTMNEREFLASINDQLRLQCAVRRTFVLVGPRPVRNKLLNQSTSAEDQELRSIRFSVTRGSKPGCFLVIPCCILDICFEVCIFTQIPLIRHASEILLDFCASRKSLREPPVLQ